MTSAIDLVEKGYVPDWLTRVGIRRFLKKRLKLEKVKFEEENALQSLIEEMNNSALAINTQDANQQHYEVPTEFYEHTLGIHKKYSCGYFNAHVTNLSTAEEEMLSISCERAGLEDGMDILELGCGWGSLTLWMTLFDRVRLKGGQVDIEVYRLEWKPADGTLGNDHTLMTEDSKRQQEALTLTLYPADGQSGGAPA